MHMMRALVIIVLVGSSAALFGGVSTAPKRAVKQQFAGAVKPTRTGVSVPRRSLEPQPEDNAPGADLPVSLAITAIRIGTCALMVHHGIDKLEHVDGFSANVVAKFFGFLPGAPQLWTYAAAATQIAGACRLLPHSICIPSVHGLLPRTRFPCAASLVSFPMTVVFQVLACSALDCSRDR